jgi:3-phosphoshikimate 1-carboxyvinyltransferase
MTASPSTSSEPRAVASGRVAGEVTPPPSKSATPRALNLALLAHRPIAIERPLVAEDTELFLTALSALGWRVERADGVARLTPGRAPASTELGCGNAGTMARFLTASLCTLPGEWRLDGVARLRERPVGPLVEALRELGAKIEYQAAAGFFPLRIAGGTLRGGRVRLQAGQSSQYLSALLMASLRAAQPVEIEVTRLVSAPYVDLTLAAMASFGASGVAAGGVYRVEPQDFGLDRLRIEGDWSAAAYPAAAAALGGRVRLRGLDPRSRQGDRAFLELLARMGARILSEADGVEVKSDRPLRAIDADLSALPDQVPTLAALAPFARGTTRIRNVPHLRIKESDRLAAMAEELRRIGAAVEELADGLIIPGVWADSEPPRDPVTVDPRGDHRIAMSLAVAGLRRRGLRIATPQVVGKSYPGFWADFEGLIQG